MDILNIDNIFNFGVPFAVLIIMLFVFIRPMVTQNREALETVTKVLQDALKQSLEACDERQSAYLKSLQTVEDKHTASIKTIVNSLDGKLDTIVETTTILMQQNERLSNDQNAILQALKVKEDQKKLENELIALKEYVKGDIKNGSIQRHKQKSGL